jgi:serine protease Do
MKHSIKGVIPLIIIVSFVVGAFGGVLGTFFLKPYLESTIWGQDFLKLEQSVKELAEDKMFQTKEESATIEVVKTVSPTVVSIVISKELDNFYNLTGPNALELLPADKDQVKRQEIGGGTGFIIDESGLILTNKHVVVDETADYSVILSDGTSYTAEILARDVVSDIAIMKIEAENLPVISLGDSDQLDIGQTVIAIGNSLSQYQNTVTRGVVSGIDRRIVASDGLSGAEVIDEAIQTDAAINPGNSGGPLLNLKGQVIGINTAISQYGTAIGFAIPVNQAKLVIDSVKKYGKIVRPWLGVRYLQVNEQIAGDNALSVDYGALIIGGENSYPVVAGSPAEKAGLLDKDIILEVNGVKVDEGNTLLKAINQYQPGDEVEIKYLREEKEETVKVILDERTM